MIAFAPTAATLDTQRSTVTATLTDRVTVHRPEWATNGVGSRTRTFTDEANVPARVHQVHYAADLTAVSSGARQVTTPTWRIVLPYGTDITTDSEITLQDGTRLQITSVADTGTYQHAVYLEAIAGKVTR